MHCSNWVHKLQVWFALEEKNIPYDTVLINLQDKPEWFKNMVPTELVPAVKINGQLVYESYDIMMVSCALHTAWTDVPIMLLLVGHVQNLGVSNIGSIQPRQKLQRLCACIDIARRIMTSQSCM